VNKISESIAQILFDFWKFDMWVYSQWWLYAPLLIPFVFYTAFFFSKWAIITAPIWIPIRAILSFNQPMIKITTRNK
jgi:hypothetical protein